MIKACFAALVALLAGFGPGADRQQRAAAVVPEVISAELPVYPAIFLQARIEGVVVVRLTTDGSRVANVDVVSASSKFFQDPAVAAAFVKSWRFAPHAPAIFESRLRFSVRLPDPPCLDNDRNPTYTAHLPTELTAEVEPDTTCSINSVVYPMQPRSRGIEGTVRLRLSPSYEVELIDGPPELAEAAIANARTWTYERMPTRVFEVQYRYRLTPGDCAPDQNPTVSMRLPTEIEIAAKRRVPCGSFFVAPHLER